MTMKPPGLVVRGFYLLAILFFFAAWGFGLYWMARRGAGSLLPAFSLLGSAFGFWTWGYLLRLLERSAIAAEATAERLASLTHGAPVAGREEAFHVVMSGEVKGPFTASALRQLAAAGVVTPETPALKTGDAEWSTLGALLPGLRTF